MRRGILGVACLLVLFAALGGTAQAARYDTHTVIVKLTSGVSAAQRAALFSGAGVTGTSGSVAGVGADVVRVTDDPAAVATRLNRSALVDYAEPNFILKATATRPRAGTRPGSAASPRRAAPRSASSTPASTRRIRS